MMREFLKCTKDDFGILTKILAITADNAANNNTFLKELGVAISKLERLQDENDILKEISKGSRDAHVIPKLRKLIVKIRASPQRRERFNRQCNLYPNTISLNPILDVRMRWNSTYLMLERAIKLQEPLNDIIGLERDLNEFLILEDEWNILRELCRVFKMFYDATLYMSNSQFVTLSSSIPIYNSLLEHLEKLLDENNKKYYCKSSEMIRILMQLQQLLTHDLN
ncbi:unnamed protein product [Rhizophagus irregularis]|nr:unnamed protein product [Rhizophagus irregularis]